MHIAEKYRNAKVPKELISTLAPVILVYILQKETKKQVLE